MTVSELIQELSKHDPNMEVYVDTPENPNTEIDNIDYQLYADYGYYRGVYITVSNETNGFIDYDGYGNHIWPSDYTELGGAKIPIDTKYILWYNR